MRLRWTGARRSGGKTGMTLIEVTIALTIVSGALMASAGAFFSSISAVQSAQRRSRATVFLETVMEDLSAQTYDGLLALDGNKIYDNATVAGSNYSIDLTVFEAALDLTQVQVVMNDMRTDRELARLTTLRCRR